MADIFTVKGTQAAIENLFREFENDKTISGDPGVSTDSSGSGGCVGEPGGSDHIRDPNKETGAPFDLGEIWNVDLTGRRPLWSAGRNNPGDASESLSQFNLFRVLTRQPSLIR